MKVPKRWVDAMGRINHHITTHDYNGVLIVLSKTWRPRQRRWEYLANPQDMVLYAIRIRRLNKCRTSQ